MIHLDLKREPHWLDLGHGVRVHVRPCTTALMMAARAEAQRSPVPSTNETQAAAERTAALVKALGRLGIQEWEGVGDADGEPVPVTPEGIDALLDLWPIAEAFERLYLGPALLLDDEKKRIRVCAPLTGAQARLNGRVRPRVLGRVAGQADGGFYRRLWTTTWRSRSSDRVKANVSSVVGRSEAPIVRLQRGLLPIFEGT